MVCSSNVKEDKFLEYVLTKSASGESLKGHVGEVFELAAFALYERVDRETGEARLAFSFMTPEGEVYGSGSPAFCDAFSTMLEVFDPDEIKAIRVISKTSKAGREYLQPVPVRMETH